MVPGDTFVFVASCLRGLICISVAAGVNFYFSVDDTGLAVAMRGNVPLGSVFRMVATSSFLAFATVLAVAVPLVASMLRDALTTRRWDIVGRLLVPFGAALVTMAWMAVASAWTGGRWVPLPWDVGGALQSWPAPPDWPPLDTRLPLAVVTFVLLVAGLVVSAIAVAQAIARTNLSRHRPIWLKATSFVLASSIVLMAIGVVSWGLFAEQHAWADFHARNGGFFSSTKHVKSEGGQHVRHGPPQGGRHVRSYVVSGLSRTMSYVGPA